MLLVLGHIALQMQPAAHEMFASTAQYHVIATANPMCAQVTYLPAAFHAGKSGSL